jgi:biopolymer transport protein ExbD
MNFMVKDEEEVKIEITPLIDVVFILLIFFMVSTTFVAAPGIKINLPKAKSDEIIRDRKDITIVISEKMIMFNKVAVKLNEIEKEFNDFKTKYDNKALVIIKADKNVSHGIVVSVMDAAKRNGFNKLGIATEPQ